MQRRNSDDKIWKLLKYFGFCHKFITAKDADLIASDSFDANPELNLCIFTATWRLTRLSAVQKLLCYSSAMSSKYSAKS
jgi:hypothetical protein